MRLAIIAVTALVVVGCAQSLDPGSVATTTPITSSSPPTSFATTTTHVIDSGGQMVKIDAVTLEPVEGFDPIQVTSNSWRVPSPNGSLVAAFDWNEDNNTGRVTVLDVDLWTTLASHQIDDHLYYHLTDEGALYAFDDEERRLLRYELSGKVTTLDVWPAGWLWDGLHELSGGRLGALGTDPADDGVESEYYALVFDPRTGETSQIPVGQIERRIEESGVFLDGVELTGRHRPAVTWGDDRVFISYIEGPEIVEVDLDDGDVVSHDLRQASWFAGLLAAWMPEASAKGPSPGTFSSAALSADGGHLFVSGNRFDISEPDEEGAVVEVTRAEGVHIVDTSIWTVTRRLDLPISFVSGHRHPGWIVGYDDSSVYLFDGTNVGDFHQIEMESPGTVDIEHSSHGERYLYVTRGARVEVVDLNVMEVVGDRLMGAFDSLVGWGVLVDLQVDDPGA